MVDCIIPVHEKDFDTLGHTLASVRRCCPQVRRIVTISRTAFPGTSDVAADWVDEASNIWPFRINDFEACCCPSPGWLFQQLLKLYAPIVVPDLSPNVLVCDADVIWLKEEGVRFIEKGVAGLLAAFACTFDADACPPIRSSVDLHRYDDFVPSVLPGLEKPRPGVETAVCHHGLFQRDVVYELMSRVEGAHAGKVFWEVFRDAARECGGRASEYDLYHAFGRRFFPDRVIARPLTFAVVADVEATLRLPPKGAAFFVAHSHLRGLTPEQLLDREGVINGDTKAQVVKRITHGQPPELAALLAGSGMF